MKHAFLILAHNNIYTLKNLIKSLDDPEINIYIHFDKKSKIPLDEIKSLDLKFSSLNFIKRHKVFWSTYSSVLAIKSLLIASSQKKYDYYHVISGVDLPIKKISTIKEFFSRNAGKEFIGFEQTYNKEMTQYKNYFIKYFKTNNKFTSIYCIFY